MTNRRNFIQQLTAAGMFAALPASLTAAGLSPLLAPPPADKKIWAALLHLSFNMWEEYSSPNAKEINRRIRGYQPTLRFDDPLWDELTKKMVSSGMNMVIIDLGDGVKYKSHPEIAVKNAWSRRRLSDELQRLRKMGLEPIPKLNFSASHDAWLGEYSRMLSTTKYYEVCRDLIAEVSDLFDKPRFFHIGMDEETPEHQKYYLQAVIRQNDLWWNDFLFLVKEVEKHGSRAWIWSDYVWHHPELFFERMPKSVMQSNWYYGQSFDMDLEQNKQNRRTYIKGYLDLEAHGYDQIPTGAYYGSENTFNTDNIMNTVKFCKEHIDDSRLKGFLITFWRPTIEEFRVPLEKGIELFEQAKIWYDQQPK